MDALNKSISLAGGQSALAALLGIKPQVVHNWLQRGNVPADKCPAIERATNGQVRCEDLRPDVDWAYLRASTPTVPAAVNAETTGETVIPATAEPVKEAA